MSSLPARPPTPPLRPPPPPTRCLRSHATGKWPPLAASPPAAAATAALRCVVAAATPPRLGSIPATPTKSVPATSSVAYAARARGGETAAPPPSVLPAPTGGARRAAATAPPQRQPAGSGPPHTSACGGGRDDPRRRVPPPRPSALMGLRFGGSGSGGRELAAFAGPRRSCGCGEQRRRSTTRRAAHGGVLVADTGSCLSPPCKPTKAGQAPQAARPPREGGAPASHGN